MDKLITVFMLTLDIDREAAEKVIALFEEEMKEVMSPKEFLQWAIDFLYSEQEETKEEAKLEYSDWHGETASFVLDEGCNEVL